jgi:hypothetical protein
MLKRLSMSAAEVVPVFWTMVRVALVRLIHHLLHTGEYARQTWSSTGLNMDVRSIHHTKLHDST